MEGRRIYVKHPSYYSRLLIHSGVKGMHWGDRLYQYKDGSLTPLGRIHYGIGAARKAINDRINREQNEDGTLTLRGKIKNKTNDKYKLMSDDDIKKQTNRLQLQKNLEQLKKETSTSYRLKSRLENVAEDVVVSGSKRAFEKIINNTVDRKLGDLFNTDKDAIAKARKKIEGYSKKEIDALTSKYKAEINYLELTTGKKVPVGHKFLDLTKEEKEGLKKENRSSKNKPEEPKVSKENRSSKNKPEEPKVSKENESSKNKPEEPKVSKENESSKNKSEEPKVSKENKSSKNKPEESKVSKENVPEPTWNHTRAFKIDRSSEKSKKDVSEPTWNHEKNYKVERTHINSSMIKNMKSSGKTLAEIAKQLGVSESTIEYYLKQKG